MVAKTQDIYILGIKSSDQRLIRRRPTKERRCLFFLSFLLQLWTLLCAMASTTHGGSRIFRCWSTASRFVLKPQTLAYAKYAGSWWNEHIVLPIIYILKLWRLFLFLASTFAHFSFSHRRIDFWNSLSDNFINSE